MLVGHWIKEQEHEKISNASVKYAFTAPSLCLKQSNNVLAEVHKNTEPKRRQGS